LGEAAKKGAVKMSTQTDQCYQCGHQRQYHTPRCTEDGCGCGGFREGMKIDPYSARGAADKFIDDAIRELRTGFPAEQIRKELLEAIDRAIPKK
jgi:hypothetical protein